MSSRSLPAALLVALVAGCGGQDPPRPGPASAQPYPPRAAEPGRAGPLSREPAGRVVRIGGPAEGVVVDPRTGLAAIAMQQAPELVLADAAGGEVRRRVRLPAAPRHLELARAGGPVLVPAEEADALAEVFLPDGRVRSTPVGAHPHDAAALGGAFFTADEFGSTVTEVRGSRRGRQVPVDVQPGGIAAVGDRLAVVSVRAYTVELLDPRTGRGGGSQSAGLGPTHVVADRAGRLYITDTRGDALTVFETRPRLKWVARIPLAGGPYGIALDEARGRVWVALARRNELVELSAGPRPRRRRTLPTVRQPNSVAVDPRDGRVLVASASEDALQLAGP